MVVVESKCGEKSMVPQPVAGDRHVMARATIERETGNSKSAQKRWEMGASLIREREQLMWPFKLDKNKAMNSSIAEARNSYENLGWSLLPVKS